MQPLIAVPATVYMIYRAWSHQSLTPAGLVAATFTAVAHAVHPWSAFFALLIAFFIAGNAVTKVKHSYKSTLTTSSSGGLPNPSTPHPRTSTQVFANSLTASLLILLHAYHLHTTTSPTTPTCLPAPLSSSQTQTQPWISLLPYGILAHYAAVTSDTFSSELGILSPTPPILLTALPLVQRVPRGTNGGITTTGTLAGALGGLFIAVVAVALTPFCASWTAAEMLSVGAWITACGVLGSLLDSALGGWLQASVVDVRSGKVVEGDGGSKVLFVGVPTAASGAKEVKGEGSGGGGRKVVAGKDYLSNNGVNFAMATAMSLVGVLGAAVMF